MFKRIISLVLVLSMVFSLNIPVFAVEGDNVIIDVPLTTFENKGRVVTLLNNYNKEYFVVTEEFDDSGNYTTPKSQKEITEDEFKTYFEGHVYNKLIVNAVAKNNTKNEWIYVKSVFDSEDRLIDESKSGTVVDGNFNSVYVDGSDKNHSWLYRDGDKFFFVSTTTTGKGEYRDDIYQDSVFTPITELEYNQHLQNKDFLYSKVVSTDTTVGTSGSVTKEIVYDVNNNPIGTPIIINNDANSNIAELSYVINNASGGRYNGLSTITSTVEKYNKKDSGSELPPAPDTGNENPNPPSGNLELNKDTDGDGIADAHEHYSYSKKVVAPTTTSQGYTKNTCSCGYTFITDYVDKLPEPPKEEERYEVIIYFPEEGTSMSYGPFDNLEEAKKFADGYAGIVKDKNGNTVYTGTDKKDDNSGDTEKPGTEKPGSDNDKPNKPNKPSIPDKETLEFYVKESKNSSKSYGPYTNFNKALEMAKKHEYNIYDNNGNLIYAYEDEEKEELVFYVKPSKNSKEDSKAYKTFNEAKKVADSKEWNVYDSNGNLVYEYKEEKVVEKEAEFYVKLNKNSSEQFGPYKTFNEAKKNADAKGLNVFDGNGNLVYKYEKPAETNNNSNKPNNAGNTNNKNNNEQANKNNNAQKVNENKNQNKNNNKTNEIKPEAIDGVMNEALLAKYNGLYSNWSDNYNKGYLGNWMDPYFSGALNVIDWEDPFWSQDEIRHSSTVESAASGYYDDAGNYIQIDSSGNPIPSEPGTFDSAGNFMPQNSTGYYDPDGVYHPLPQYISGIKYDFDGSFHIDNYGYFDVNGIWHPAENDGYKIIIFDGRVVYKNGYMENPSTGVKVKIGQDIWGHYYFNDEVIYSDFSVYNKKTNQLTLANGTVYDGKTEGNIITFGNNDAVIKGSFEKGKKIINGVVLDNDTVVTASGVIQYPNGITYTTGVGASLPNNEIINESFLDKDYIDLGNYGRIYNNGHIATYNEFNNLITDMDAVIYEDRVLLANGDIFVNGNILNTYRDKNGNLVSPDGYVISSNLELGAYAHGGIFQPGAKPTETGYFDRLGNIVNFNGSVTNEEKTVGYYDKDGRFVEGIFVNNGSYYTAEGNRIYKDNTVEKPELLYGYYDKDGNFVMNDGGGLFDKKGTFSQKSTKDYFIINSNGLFYNDTSSKFTLNIDGSISVIGEKGTYDENGMVTLNGDTGYYDESGMFIISKENPYVSSGYFYDSLQTKHSLGTIYRDSNGALKLLQNPIFGLQTTDNGIKLASSDLIYSLDGLTTVNGKTGYYNSSAKFTEAKVSPYKGGFYTESGFWVDKSYYTNTFGEIEVNYGGFNRLGNWVTPTGDVGSFDKTGKFIINKTNTLSGNFYDNSGTLRTVNGFYIDKFGIIKNINGTEAYGANGLPIALRDSIGMKIGDYIMTERGMFISPDGTLGHFNSSGEFIEGRNEYADGFFTPSGGFVTYGNDTAASVSANFSYILNKYYVVYNNANAETTSQTAVLTMSDGYAFDVTVIQGKYFELSNGLTISNTGKVGHMEGLDFVEGLPERTKMIINTTNNDYIDVSDEYGYFSSDGTFVLYDGGYGYYNADGTLIPDALNPYSNGFYNYEGTWTQINKFSNIANIGYFNKYGIKRNGQNPYNLGYYDYEGSFHPYEKEYFITSSGNVVEIGDDAIGYIDNDNRLFLYEQNGYFDADGNYYIDTTLQGYYDANGVLNNGKNPNFDGFYDMLGNWHIFGDKGYYDKSGYYHDDVADSKMGYFNEVGEFTSGYNPYINGYNDINGNWSDSFTMPLTVYYEKDGIAKIGSVPYSDGYYDMYGNWHRFRDKGYFDKFGTYYSSSNGSGGYYDAKGNYFEGTNPYQHGYYDEDGNLRLFEHEGYFTKNGTFVDDKGSWYFLKDGLKKKGENPREEGFYDKYGNYYPFDENGYYTPEGLFFPTLLVVDKYRVGSTNYVLFEGIFTNPEFVPSSSKNTVQFTFNGDSGAPLFVDTGIKVSKNAMIPYSKARDILHNIAVYSHSTFIEDNDSCLVIVDGKIINLTNNGKMSINELRNKFLDSNISITVTKTRIGQKFALADSIEAQNNIKLLFNDKSYAIRNPMVVTDGAPYISLKDVTEIISYNVKVEKRDGKRAVYFELKDSVPQYMKDKLPAGFSVEIGSTECLVNIKDNTYTYYILKAPIITRSINKTGIEEVYLPIYLLGNLTGQSLEYNTLTYTLEFYAENNELPFEDN